MKWIPLIITVTVDPAIQDPLNPRVQELKTPEPIAKDYIASNEAGAVIDHIHGSYSGDPVIQPDGKKLQIANLEGTKQIIDSIRSANPKNIIQQGLASMRLEKKMELWELVRPDMSSLNVGSHDEYFDPYPNEMAPHAIYSVHPIAELREYFQKAREYGVKPELECFDTGAFDAIRIIRDGIFWNDEGEKEIEKGLLDDPLWATFFFGWPGQSCQPMTDLSLFNQIYHKPERLNWSTSCMSREPTEYWAQINRAILQNGHVRGGYEDCGKFPDGSYAKSCADLVDWVVKIAKNIGRPIASAEEARSIVGIN